MAAMCINAMLPPAAFGLDDVDQQVVAEAMVELLDEEQARQHRRDLLDQLKGR